MRPWVSQRWLVSSFLTRRSISPALLIVGIGLDHSAEGIRVNAVCPTWVRTPLLDEELQKNPEVQGMISAVVPIKRAAECEEVSDVVAFLCSPAASYINGTSLLIDAAVTTTVRLF
jgi:NAD(P)-dependent dehydrogenase (short-subunit alcohol dehydrogenase family)